MAVLFQTAGMGILMGGLYALLAIAIVLIFKATKVFNLGSGGLLMAGAYIFYFLFAQMKLPVWLCLILLLAVSIVIGLAIERLTMRPLIGHPDPLAAVIMTLALAVFFEGVMVTIWGGGIKSYPPGLPTGVLAVGEGVLPQILIIGFAIAVGLAIGLAGFFHYHRLGLAMKVTAESHQIAQSLGIDVKAVFAISWTMATAMSMVTGAVLAAHMGLSEVLPNIALKALAVVLVGGLNSLLGAFVGGFIVGITEALFASYLTSYIGSGVGELAPYLILLVILLVRPHGLFGIKEVERI